jgi:hypothetical protein
MAAKASFVFLGTVQQLQASNLPEVSDKSNTAIVHVDRTIQSPQVLSHYTGQDITVQLAQPVSVGDQVVFFTNAWVFGNKGVAVRSLGHMAPGAETPVMHLTHSDPVVNLENRNAMAHLDAAAMVISGTVTSVRVVPEAEPNRPPREHDPHWQEATISVSKVIKGGPPPEEVLVRFPASGDRAWHRVPNLKPGDKGQFALHKPESEANYYVLKDEKDFEPESSPGPMHRIASEMEVP